MTGPPALLVSKHSATLSCNVSLPINRNHSEIVKFPYQHNDYFVVLNRLRKLKESCRIKQPLHHPQLAENEKTALRSLGFPEQHWRRDEINPAERICEWLLQNQTFNTWLDPQDKMERLLWVVGNPGTGKSTMMKYVFNVIEQQWHVDYVLISSSTGAASPYKGPNLASCVRSSISYCAVSWIPFRSSCSFMKRKVPQLRKQKSNGQKQSWKEFSHISLESSMRTYEYFCSSML